MTISHSGEWNEANCSSSLNFVCEKDGENGVPLDAIIIFSREYDVSFI